MERLIDFLAEEEMQQQTPRRVKMTEQQRLEYKLYRRACKINNVEPVLADFLAGDINSGVIRDMELAQKELEWDNREREEKKQRMTTLLTGLKTFAAHA